jgi:DnaJ family protein C protein 8
MTSEKQIERLVRPGSKYFNLNPFEVLAVSYDADLDEVKKAFRKLSILVHPDKNGDNPRARDAFSAVNHAYKSLQDQGTFDFCKQIIKEARRRVEDEIREKKRKQKAPAAGANSNINLDDPTYIDNQVRLMTFKLFAEVEQKKNRMEELDAAERKRKREKELEEMERAKLEAELKKKWEEQREQRVNTWRNFQKKKLEPEKKKARTGLRPPHLKTAKD